MNNPNFNLDIRPGYKLVRKVTGNREEYYYEPDYFSTGNNFFLTILTGFIFVAVLVAVFSFEPKSEANTSDFPTEQARIHDSNNVTNDDAEYVNVYERY